MRVGIVGAGGWGTALARVAATNADSVVIWARESEVQSDINNRHTNRQFLKGVALPANIHAVGEFGYLADCELIIMAVPSAYVRDVSLTLKAYLDAGTPVANAAKGFEVASQARLSVVMQEVFGEEHPIAVLSGPNHAEEVGRQMPTATVIASHRHEVAKTFQSLLMTPLFRVYTSKDVIGVELGGALKNIIALAAGVTDGLGYGDNTKAALMTRGMTEIIRLGKHMGALPATFGGLSGMGDLIATCTSAHSRNSSAGLAIGQGRKLADIVSSTNMVIEGVNATQAAFKLSQRHGVKMPITSALYSVLFEDQDPAIAVAELMNRQPKSEDEEELAFGE